MPLLDQTGHAQIRNITDQLNIRRSGQIISLRKSQSTILLDGDEIIIGDVRITYRPAKRSK